MIDKNCISTYIMWYDEYDQEVKPIHAFEKVDFDVGNTRSFELTMSFEQYKKTPVKPWQMISLLWSPDVDEKYTPLPDATGLVESIEVDSDTKTVKLAGPTLTEMIQERIVQCKNVEYLMYTGTLAHLPADLLTYTESTIVTAPYQPPDSTHKWNAPDPSVDIDGRTVYGGSFTNYKIDRWCTLLDALKSMGREKGYRPYTLAKPVQTDGVMGVQNLVGLTPLRDLRQDIEDAGLTDAILINSKTYYRTINHMWALGAGDMQARLARQLFLGANGGIIYTPDAQHPMKYGSFDLRSVTYDYKSAESETELLKHAVKRFKEYQNQSTSEVKFKDTRLKSYMFRIGDIVTGTNELTGETKDLEITNCIYTIQKGAITITYECKFY